MDQTAQFFQVFADIAIKFSNLEFVVGEILDTLIDPENEVIGGLLTSDVSLAKKLEHIKKLAHFRFANNSEMEARIRDLMLKVDGLRRDRNSFVHGMWVMAMLQRVL